MGHCRGGLGPDLGFLPVWRGWDRMPGSFHKLQSFNCQILRYLDVSVFTVCVAMSSEALKSERASEQWAQGKWFTSTLWEKLSKCVPGSHSGSAIPSLQSLKRWPCSCFHFPQGSGRLWFPVKAGLLQCGSHPSAAFLLRIFCVYVLIPTSLMEAS